jgi:GNAT superfamily N-acetyltransferase
VKVERRAQPAQGVRFSINRDDREVARAYLYVMTNDLHDAPFGLLEDVFVSESERGSGLGTLLVKEVVAAAREAGCYKLVATSRASRPKVHALYERLGFTNYGVEFRMNLDAADADEHRITIATAGQIANLKPQGS